MQAEEKKKPKTSSEVKRRYNNKAYGIITAMLPKDLVADFKKKCAEQGISQAQIVREAVEQFLARERTI